MFHVKQRHERRSPENGAFAVRFGTVKQPATSAREAAPDQRLDTRRQVAPSAN